MAGLVGSSNNPVSGITIATILTSALLLLGMGIDKTAGPVAAILIGGVVCCAASIGADNVQDLKCGQLVGSTPWKQQVMQIVGVVVAASLMAPILNLLNEPHAIGSAEGLQAPQANLMASVSKGVFLGGLPKLYIAIGAAIAVAVIILDNIAQAKNWPFRTPVMAFAVGVYLPFDLSTPILFGGLVAWAVNRAMGPSPSEERKSQVERQGLLFAAGLITGEALMGVILAALTSLKVNIVMFASKEHPGGEHAEFIWPGIALVVLSMWMTYKAALKKE
jgi:putative OPT family oligopeptide transporter